MEIVSCKLCSHYICRTIFDKDIEPFCALGYPLEPCPDFEEENHKMYTSLVEDNEALNKRVGELEARIVQLEIALREMVYETTHLSREEDDGSHRCTISKEALEQARAALAGKEGE